MVAWWRGNANAKKLADGPSEPTPVRFSPHVKRQLWIVAFCRFSEPVALTSVFPYLYFMIKSFGVTEDRIAFWVGVTSASFAFSQFTSGVFWGRAGDRFGRKPVLLFGLMGTLISSLIFGFSKSLPQAIAARCLAGVLNGNVGIMRTLVAEMVPEKELQPRAFSLMPLVWAVGSMVGPILGGYLSEPVKNYPGIFAPGGLFSEYPYALPNIVSASIFATSTTIGFLFLEESLETRKNDRDIGRELGRRLTSFFSSSKSHKHKPIGGEIADETTPLIVSRELAGHPPKPADPSSHPIKHHQSPPALREVFTKQCTLNIIVYAFLALQSITYDQMLPVYMAYPKMTHPPQVSNPLKFFGGFGLNSGEIGLIFSIFGFIAMITQVLLYPPITRRFGALYCLIISLALYPLAYVLSPFAVILPPLLRRPFLYTLIIIKCYAGTFSFPCSMILLTNSAPSLRLLGTVNGIATALAALGRAIGPTIGGAIFSYGGQISYLILPFWVMGCISTISLVCSFKLVEGKSLVRGDEETAPATITSTVHEVEEHSPSRPVSQSSTRSGKSSSSTKSTHVFSPVAR